MSLKPPKKKTVWLDLDFKHNNGGPPGPVAQIILKDEKTPISFNCVMFQEIEGAIDMLTKELERLKKRAKWEFAQEEVRRIKKRRSQGNDKST